MNVDFYRNSGRMISTGGPGRGSSGYPLTEKQKKLIDGLSREKPVHYPTLPGSKTYELKLSCYHLVEFVAPQPAIGDTLYCRSCKDYAEVI